MDRNRESSSLITFIVPVYNVEKYVEQCLMSLVNQSVANHKVVVVNDGSTDSSGDICQSMALRYPNLITYIEKENGGLGSARNAGLKLVETPYLTFLDSDDWENSLFVEKFQNLIERKNQDFDVVFCEPIVFDSVTKSIYPFQDNYLLDDVFPNDIITNASSTPDIYSFEVSSCRKIYRTEFLKELDFSFSSGKWEDVRPHFHILHSAKYCARLKGAGFFYRVNIGSQITADTGKGRLDIIPVFKETLEIAKKENFSELEMAYVVRLFMIFSRWFIDVTNDDYILPLLKGLHKIYNLIQKRYLKAYFSSLSPSPRKDKLLVALLRGPFYGCLRNRKRARHFYDILKSIKRRIVK